jgi:hypothetical protein
MASDALSRSERGGVLLVAFVLSTVMAVAVASLLKLSSNALTMSQRSALSNDAMNLAEAGLELALWSFNQAHADNPEAWNGWQPGLTDDDRRRTFTEFAPPRNSTAAVKVYLRNFNSTGVPVPVIISQATIQPAKGAPIQKVIEVQLTRRSFFATGLVGRRGVTLNGTNVTIDSWISGIDRNPGSPTPYSLAVRRPYGSVATLALDASVAVQNANVYGFVSVGAQDTGGHVSLGPNGVISGDFNAPSGTRDEGRIAGNFTVDLPNVAVPTPVTVTTITAQQGVLEGGTYPRATGAGTIQDPINVADNTYYYRISALDLDPTRGKAKDLVIRNGCRVVFLIHNAAGGLGNEVVSTGATSSLTIQPGASLAIYTNGNVRLAGNGVANLNGSTTAFQIWGTNTSASGQTIAVTGNAGLTGIIYAPNGHIDITGNGDVFGAVVGDRVRINGNSGFHYDESLANFGGNNPFRVSIWRELVAAPHRAAYDAELNF